jgi:hypothetical protein
MSAVPAPTRVCPPRAAPRVAFGLRLFGPPLVAFVAAQCALVIAAGVAGYPASRPTTSWSRFDSAYYVSIAQAGYSVAPCGPARPPGTWCGNAGWFPGYPVLTSFPVQLGAPVRPAAWYVSLACCLAALGVVWIGFLGAQSTPRNWLCLLMAAFTPGQVYYHTIFPLALAGLALLLVLLYAGRERWLAAGVAGAVLTATYPSGALIIPVTAVWLLFRRDGAALRTRIERIVLTSGVASLGGLFVLVIQRVQTGHWGAFFDIHRHYHNYWQDPLPQLVRSVRPIFSHAPTIAVIPHYEAAFAAALVVLVCVAVLTRRGRPSPLDSLLVLTLLAYWLVPLAIHHMDLYRSDALLIPAALLLRRAALPFQFAGVACGIALSVPMGEAFLVRVLG